VDKRLLRTVELGNREGKSSLKVVILAGGLGTRLAEQTDLRPKPMVEIGGQPILWHIMKHYAGWGFNEFFIALGYKGEVVKRYFLDYHALAGNMTINLAEGVIDERESHCEDWLVHLVDTGADVNTGGRVRRLQSYVGGETFMLSYGDGVSNVNLPRLLAFHRSHGCLATVTAVRPPARFGGLVLEDDVVLSFSEKPQIGEGWINGGFLVLEDGVFDYLHGDATSLESDALEHLARDGQLMAYQHDDFWQCMDTVRDLRLLEAMWATQCPPWKTWQ
jgi:glucose-1-phosphate cytidylyltransferase